MTRTEHALHIAAIIFFLFFALAAHSMGSDYETVRTTFFMAAGGVGLVYLLNLAGY